MRRSSLLPRLLVVLLTLAALIAASVTTTSAQEEITFRIAKYTCPADPGNVSVAAGNIPPECTPTSGVSFTVAAEDGTTIGTCTTDATGMCSLQVPNEATVTVTEDEATAPAGYAPRENPITTQAVTEFAGALFINLPVAAPTPTPAPSLPPTGTGSSADVPGSPAALPAMLALATLACGAVALAIRRRAA